MNGQQYRYRSRRKTTTGCGDCVVLIMRIREVRHQAITLAGAVPDIRNCSAYESHCLLRSKMGTQPALCGKSVV